MNDAVGPKNSLSLPTGGGAVRGIGETFEPDLFSGAGNFVVPIATSPGRSDFGPTLAVHYSSGNGNGPFGLGWQLSIPRITRKTEKGLPTYTDQDSFVLSGAEDLVPYLVNTAQEPDDWEPDVTELGGFLICRYRPRTEGQFARIERWIRLDGDVHWRATTKENITNIYGRSASARIVDPSRPEDVYQWLLEETFDAKGNHILYEYLQEDPALAVPGLHEQNRTYTQAYIRRILYGNTPEALDPSLLVGPNRTATSHINPLETQKRHYLLHVLFDYGDLPEELDTSSEFKQDTSTVVPASWPIRTDPFSSFRAGFEMRTLRRCHRVLMLHHFEEGELVGAPLVRSTSFEYLENPDTKLSFLSSAKVTGYRKDSNDPRQYVARSLPPVTFTYSEFEPTKQRYQTVSVDEGELPPRSLNSPDLIALDLFGNGLTGIVEDTGSGLHYWENLGGGRLARRRQQSGAQPDPFFAQARTSFGDMGGDGLADLLVDDPPLSGFYESTPDGTWEPFRRFETQPNFDLADQNTRLVDLTGDGLSDVLETRDTHFLWYQCLAEAGYAEPRRIPRIHDLDRFPDVFFDDPSSRVRLADMTGDGLLDIVLVHDGRVDYWPNLGYGRFGLRITMSNTPRIGFDYDPRRLFLADLDGSGGTDLIFVDQDEVHFWFNQSGNGWSEQNTIKGTPPVSDLSSVQFGDFHGTGTTSLMWSFDAGQHPGSNYKILDFCGGKKPNLLIEMSNNMGATTRAQFATSTKFYLEDEANGLPWITSLPFPVQVLEKTEMIDHVNNTKLVTEYRYHHGYYDGREREFRGFGRVDQFDTEFFDDFDGSSLHGDDVVFENGQPGFHTPPIETRNWFHTGVYFDSDRNLDHRELTERYRAEYFQGDPQAFEMGPHTFEDLGGDEGFGSSSHEAFRALRGAILRSEIYGRDGSSKANLPYEVTESRHRVKTLQPKGENGQAVYLNSSLETVSYDYERKPKDPRTSQNITLAVDDFGNVTDSVEIGYPRRVVPDELPEHGEINVVATHIDFINHDSPPTVDTSGFYYAGIRCQSRVYDVTGMSWQEGDPAFTAADYVEIQDSDLTVDTTTFKPYQWTRDENESGVQRRIIEWTRNYFRSDANPELVDTIDNLDHRLPLGQIESLALPYESYQVAFTSTLLSEIFGERLAVVDLFADGGFHPHPSNSTAEGAVGIEEYLWIPSGRQNFNAKKFLQPETAQDPFGNLATMQYDIYGLLLEITSDALPAPQTNVWRVENDYRVLQPFEAIDPNNNRSQLVFDALGLVVGTAMNGEDAEGRTVGDSLAGFAADLPDDLRDQHLDDPLNLDPLHDTDGHNILKGANTRLIYDLDRFATAGQPNVVYAIAREDHISDENGTPSGLQHAFTYSDGFGRQSQVKVQAEPDSTTPTKPRWVGTGTIVYNNKGDVVQQYEPFFSDHHNHAIEQHGISPAIFYDPLGRVICAVKPDHSYEKVLFDPWRHTTWDSNDTVLLDPRTDPDVAPFVGDYFRQYDQEFLEANGRQAKTWHQDHSQSDDPAKQRAAAKTEAHANTPTVSHLDSLDRPFLSVSDNGIDADGNHQTISSRVVFDVEGNHLESIDAVGRVVMRYRYDLLGNPLHEASMEAGEQWMLDDVEGDDIHLWDSRGHHLKTTYDALRRPTDSLLQADANTVRLVHRVIYGESLPNAEASNLKGQTAQTFDQAGVETTLGFDFKGNELGGRRQLAREYKATLDWSADVPLEAETFVTTMRYDALDRVVETQTPDKTVVHPRYNVANLLEGVEVRLRGAAETTSFVTNIEYDAKGQRELVDFGNGVGITYSYDPMTFRLTHMLSRRDRGAFPDDCPDPRPTGFPGCDVQSLHYTYDPVGNITTLRDDAQQTLFFRNQRVEPSNDYTYDAVYRLIEATGREHVGQGEAPTPHASDDALRVALAHPGDGTAMANYEERYLYDAVDNLLTMQHSGTDPALSGWARSYNYSEPGLLEDGVVSNRLSSTRVGDTTLRYGYEGSAGLHGNVTSMPHLSFMQWDYRDQLQATSRQAVDGGSQPEITWYVYDGDGERIRKLTETANGKPKQERIYLGGFEIFRRYKTDGSVATERESLHISDDARRIALVETLTISDDSSAPTDPLVRFQFGNHLGSAGLELDHEGKIISYEEFTPYGSTSYQAGRSLAEVQRKRYRYTGMERDEESGLSYHSARYYAPWLARWIATDPLGTADHLNLYLYARSDPLGFSDVGGEEPKRPKRTFRQRAKNSVLSTILHAVLASTAIIKPHVGMLTAARQMSQYDSIDPDTKPRRHPLTDQPPDDKPDPKPKKKRKNKTKRKNETKRKNRRQKRGRHRPAKPRRGRPRRARNTPRNAPRGSQATRDAPSGARSSSPEPGGGSGGPKDAGTNKKKKAKGGKGVKGGYIGLIYSAITVGFEWHKSGDFVEAVKSLNPAPRTTEAVANASTDEILGSAADIGTAAAGDAFDATVGTAIMAADLALALFHPSLGRFSIPDRSRKRASELGVNGFCDSCHGEGGALQQQAKESRLYHQRVTPDQVDDMLSK